MKTTLHFTKVLAAFAFSVAFSSFAQTNAVFDRQHIDLKIFYAPDATNKLSIKASNASAGMVYDTNEVLLVVKTSAQYPGGLPSGTPFGNAGEPIWILPQSQNPSLLYLGFSAEGIPNGIFNGSELTIQLTGVKAGGNFFGWQAGSGGSLNVMMNTRDGISSADNTTPLVGSHEHQNFGFSTNGVYCVTFQASGVRTGEATNQISLNSTFQFNVLPLNPFETWQSNHWAFATPAAVINPEADPDGDGIVNVMEYALNLNPTNASREGIPTALLVNSGGTNFGALRFTRLKNAPDIFYEVWAANDITAMNWTQISQVVSVTNHGLTESVVIRDNVPVTASSQRFFQLKVRFWNRANYGCGCF